MTFIEDRKMFLTCEILRRIYPSPIQRPFPWDNDRYVYPWYATTVRNAYRLPFYMAINYGILN